MITLVGIVCLLSASVFVALAAWGVRDRSVAIGRRRVPLTSATLVAWAVVMLLVAVGLSVLGGSLLAD